MKEDAMELFISERNIMAPRVSRCLAIAGLGALLLSTTAFCQGTAPAVSCESLAKLELPEVMITQVQSVAAGQFKDPRPAESNGPGGPEGPGGSGAQNGPPSGGPPKGGAPQGARGPFGATDISQLPAFCRVSATLKPSGDSDIKMEIWLPLTNWNGKFMGAGSFGWGGSIMYDGLLLGLKNGYAVANNDTGHSDATSPTGEFGLGHPDKVIDYGYRANHSMTLDSKAIIKAFYGVAPKHSYWVGCSLGGQQGMTEIQRFPDDYDGAVIGSPANPIVNLNAFQIWPTLLHRENPAGILPASKSALVQKALEKTCATPLEIKLGYLENPLACHFDPKVLQCKDADGDDCLTAAQVDMLEKQQAGLKNPRTGELIYVPTAPSIGGGNGMMGGPGGPGPGGAKGEEAPMGIALGLFKYLVFQDPNWDWKTFDMDKDITFANKVLSTVNMATNPNLKPFFDRGGKLLMYHGWNDGSSPLESFNYYKEVLKAVGPEANDSMRVFGMPGVGHCSGGSGCDRFDMLGTIDKWVQGGEAPERIVATKSTDGKVVRTHPLCAYPKVASYTGSDDPDDAANFTCVN
jgi:feruloyl esterase